MDLASFSLLLSLVLLSSSSPLLLFSFSFSFGRQVCFSKGELTIGFLELVSRLKFLSYRELHRFPVVSNASFQDLADGSDMIFQTEMPRKAAKKKAKESPEITSGAFHQTSPQFPFTIQVSDKNRPVENMLYQFSDNQSPKKRGKLPLSLSAKPGDFVQVLLDGGMAKNFLSRKVTSELPKSRQEILGKRKRE